MSGIPVFIPFVNRPDLLALAVSSVPRRMTTYPFIINNSKEILPYIFAEKPDSPLTFSQTQNLMLRIAKVTHVPFYFFMHSDAEAGPDTIERLYHMAIHECARRQWGAIFTNYDALAAFNVAAMEAIGGWDEGFEWYAGDADTYRRLRLAGYPTIESNLPVKHTPSQTLNSDPEIKRRVDEMFQQRVKRYVEKWGGDIGAETFDKPWGGK